MATAKLTEFEAPWTAEMTVRHWRYLLLAAGYRERADTRTAGIDRPIAELGRCECGAQLRYAPMTTARRYHAFAVCDACNLATEF